MAKVKVYELAKELNIGSKEIIKFLSEKNIKVTSHMNNLEDSSIELVKNKFLKKESDNITKPETNMKIREEKPEEKQEGKQEEKREETVKERPKKKSSITAVFNPQNSQQGIRRKPRPQRRMRDHAHPERAARPAARPVARPVEQPSEKQTVKTEPKKEEVVKQVPVQNIQEPERLRTEEKKPEVPKIQTAEKVLTAEKETTSERVQQPVKAQEIEKKPETAQQEQVKQPVKVSQPVKTEQPKHPQQPSEKMAARPQSEKKQTNKNYNGSSQERNQENRNENRYSNGSRTQGERGGRTGEKNQKNYQNNRQNSNYTQGDRGGRGFHSNRPKEFKGKLDREISKFNKEATVTTEEIRGKETRERNDNRKNNNRRQDHDKLGKKQERFINLEKHGGRKKPQQPKQEKAEDVIKSIVLPERLTIKELADKMKVQAAMIVKKLFLKGTMVTVNQEVDYDTAEEIALEFNCIAEQEEKVDVIAELLKEEEEAEDKLAARPPVVCVMGHVDHGKTSLLDAIRSTRVTDREAGGITQHIGASVVSINNQKITFLDTPGHEAFTAMRMRGANATDIAILVVAADDGVMPQTVEAINHAKAAGIEIIVAVNKIDKPNANIERVKQELSEYELIPEDWGGSTIFCPVSAHTHEGIDNLLEMILLTAEVSELKANPNRNARGLVIEAQLDKGRGAVATILVQKGTLRVGEPIACGSCFGKVRAMIDDNGRRVKEAGPSTPVEILGLSGVPNAGEVFVSTDTEKEARNFAETFISEGKERLLEETKSKMSLDDLFSQIQSGNVKELDLIVKADVQGSVEAVKQSLEKLSNEEVVVKTIHGGVGAINESDVILASASNAIIIGFNVRPDVTAKATAEREGVDIRLYKVIYNAIEDVEAAMKGMLDPVFEEKILGHAEVRQIFKASGVGNIAGSYVLDGTFERGCKVRLSREGKQIFEGNLASLKRFKDDVKEVRAGYECGLVLEGFNDILEFDQIEAYKMVEVPR